jgi:hypothetical protein
MITDWLVPVAMGIGLSAAAGFRVFVPMLVAAVSARFGILPLQDSLSWLSSWAAIACFATATVVEVAAYHIPFVDHLLDAVNGPLAMAAGTILAVSVLPADQEWMRWIYGILVGGGTAGVIHAGTSLLRLASTKTTAGLGNSVVASGEHAASLGVSVGSLFMPVLVALFVVATLLYILTRIKGLLKSERN